MPAYVALIRGIGPATHAKMGMAALRDACDAAGLSDVATVGNTGNILLRSRAGSSSVRRLVQGVVAGFGLANEVFVRTPVQVAEVVAANPFPEAARDRPSATAVCSFHEAPDWAPLLGWDGPEKVAAVGAHLVVAYPHTGPSSFRIEKLLGARMTARNWKVFAGLAQRLETLSER